MGSLFNPSGRYTPHSAGRIRSGDERKPFFYDCLDFAAIAILAIAWINYINLTVARSMERAKEVGVRRVVGAFRKQLIHQFCLKH